MNKKVTLFFSLVSCFLGAQETKYKFDQAIYTLRAEGVSISINGGQDETTVLSVVVNGKKLVYSGKELFGAKGAIIKTVTLLTMPINQRSFKEGELVENGFIISFEYGRAFFHGTPDDEFEAGSVLRLYFSQGDLVKSAAVVPVGEYKNRWKTFEKYPRQEIIRVNFSRN